MKFWTVSAVLGMCLTCFTVLYFFYFSKAHEESRLLNIVNYVKVQCSVYTRYNEVSECKCLIRAIDSARQVSVVIDAKTQDGFQHDSGYLSGNDPVLIVVDSAKDYVQKAWTALPVYCKKRSTAGYSK